jgi:hypothetical protein
MLYSVCLMLWSVIKPVIRVIDIFCVVLLAGAYVFTYYDYLHTATQHSIVISQPTGSGNHSETTAQTQTEIANR